MHSGFVARNRIFGFRLLNEKKDCDAVYKEEK